MIAVLAQIERKKILDAVEAAEKKGAKLVNDQGEKITEKDVVTEVVQVIEPEVEVESLLEVEAPPMERSQSASDSGIGSEPDSEEEKEKKESVKVASAAPPRPPRREGLRSRKQ